MRWALIGASNIAATRMIAAIRAAGGEIVSLMGAGEARVAAYAAEHGIPLGTTDLAAALDGAQATYISSTNEKHAPQAHAAIAAGCHVLCEKPLAMTVTDAAGMVRAAEGAGLVFGTNHHLRNAGSHIAIREAIRAGRIGAPLAVQVHHAVSLPEALRGWRLDAPNAGGGVIPDIVVHDADTVRFHLGEDPAEVTAIESQGALGRGVEDAVMSVWRMPSGVLVQTHEAFTIRHAGTGLEIHGEEGSIVARGVMTGRPVGEVTLRHAGGEEAIPFEAHDLYERSARLFAAACRGEGQPAATGRDGVASLAVAAAVKVAATSGRRVAVDYGGML